MNKVLTLLIKGAGTPKVDRYRKTSREMLFL